MEFMKRRRKLSSVQIIVLFYTSAVVVSTLLLWLPFLHKPGVELSFIDALFTGVSAISVTGLTVVSTADTFNPAGVMVLSVILQFGGIGIMTLGTFLWIIMGRKIGLEQRKWIAIDQNRSTFSGLVTLMKTIFAMALIIEAIGMIILGTYYLWKGYYTTWYEAYYYGFFSSLSAFTNAGFDIFGDSLMQFANDYFVQSINIILLILGAVGFPVLVEVKNYLSQVHLRKKYHFSLYTKITTATFFALLVIGAVVIYMLESQHFLADKSWHESFFYSLFNSVTTRNGGLATMDVSLLTIPTLLFMSILMFVGASPSSVGGGIRTTTFTVMILAILAFMRGRNEVKVFKRELHHEDISKSFVVFFVAVSLVVLSIILLMVTESFTLMQVIFEVCSAFGTTGLSMGITPELSTTGKIIIIFLMFVGRIGIISFLFLLKKEARKADYHYPEEKIIIG